MATVLAVGTECDIACLTVKDDEFWEGTEAVIFGELPHLQDSILVIGCGPHYFGLNVCQASARKSRAHVMAINDGALP